MRFPRLEANVKAWADSLIPQLNNILSAIQGPDDLLPYVGEIILVAGPMFPNDCLQCNGQVIFRKAYPSLFQVLGTTKNTGGEPLDSFRVPSLAAKTPTGFYYVIRASGKIPSLLLLAPAGTL